MEEVSHLYVRNTLIIGLRFSNRFNTLHTVMSSFTPEDDTTLEPVRFQRKKHELCVRLPAQLNGFKYYFEKKKITYLEPKEPAS